MSKCIDEETINSVINRYLKRRNYISFSNGNTSQTNINKFTLRELIANEFVLNIGSYDHLVEMSTNTSNKNDYLASCDKCLVELFDFLETLNYLDVENKTNFLFSTFLHFFIDLFQNDYKEEAKIFYLKHQTKFNHQIQFKKTIDMLWSSLRTTQLDKKIIKIRNSKICITICESDHRLLLNFLENESLSKNLHQIINQNFSFTIIPDNLTRPIKNKKLSTNSISDYSIFDTNVTANFKSFNKIFKMNNDNDEKIDSKKVTNGDVLSKNEEDFDKEYKKFLKKLKTISPSLPELIVYKVSNSDFNINCSDITNDLRYCCFGTENSDILIHESNEKKLWTDYCKKPSKWLSNVDLELIENQSIKNKDEFLEKSYSLYGHHETVLDLKFIPNSSLLLSCSIDTNVILWNLKDDDHLKKKYYGHTQPIYGIDVNCLGTHFATASKDYTSRLFSIEKSNLLRSFVGHQNNVNCVHFHPNSKYIATGSNDNTVRMWDILTSNMVRVFNCQTEIYSLAYSLDGKYLATAGSDNKIKIWDLTLGKLFIEFNSNHTNIVNNLSFNHSSTVLVSSSIDQQINFWNFKAFQQTDTFYRKDEPYLISKPILNKNLLIKVCKTKFIKPDLLIAIGT